MKALTHLMALSWLAWCFGAHTEAQQLNLPQGIGIYQFGYRQFVPQTDRFNAAGVREPIGAPFSANFDGQSMLGGAGGAELKDLANNLDKFSSRSGNQDSLLNEIDLGQMHVDVDAKVSARIFGTAYGIRDYLTLFLAVPFVSVDVNTNLQHSGGNNADAIRQRLGNTAMAPLRDGLVRAASLNAQMIKDGIAAQGYAPFDHWSHSGIGDLQIGTSLGNSSYLWRSVEQITAFRTTVMIPTGYVEQPELLTDVNVGTGHYSLVNELAAHWIHRRSLWLGGFGRYQYNFATQLQKRLPLANEALVDAERTHTVEFHPAAETIVGGRLGYNFSIFKLQYELGSRSRGQDRYSGSEPGNYDALTNNSSSGLQQLYQQASLKLQTIELFQRNSFPIPLDLTMTAHRVISARNAPLNESYYEISLASFFQNPFSVERDTKRRLRSARRAELSRKDRLKPKRRQRRLSRYD